LADEDAGGRTAGGQHEVPGSRKSRNQENTMENQEIAWGDREIEKSHAGCVMGRRTGWRPGFPGSRKSRNRENTRENQEIASGNQEIEKSKGCAPSVHFAHQPSISRFLDRSIGFLDFPLCFLDFSIFSILEIPDHLLPPSVPLAQQGMDFSISRSPDWIS